MRSLDERERRQADLFYADLLGGRPPRPPHAVVPVKQSPSTEALSDTPPPVGAGRLFDRIVHRGMNPNELLSPEADGEQGGWETLALPGSATSPKVLRPGALVVVRALGDAQLASLRVLDADVQAGQLYGRDGRIRPVVLVLVHRPLPRLTPRNPETMDTAEGDDDGRSADSVADDSPLELDPAYNSDDATVPPVWELCHQLRELVKKPKTDKASRDTLEHAAERQLRTLRLYEHVGAAYKTMANGEQRALILYVLLFPGEARDNTGLKDLNDNVLGYNLHTQYIRARQKHIRDIFKPPFSVVGQDYKTALILANEPMKKNAVGDNRAIFDQRLRKLDAALRDELLPLLKQAENNPKYKAEAKKLRAILEANPDYRFDIYHGLSVATPPVVRVARQRGAPASPDPLYTVFLMLTEALKAAGIGRFIAKGASLKGKVAKRFVKGIDPDKKVDRRGKLFEHDVFLETCNRAMQIKRFVLAPPSNDNLFLDYNHVYIDTVWTVAFFPQQFVSNSDVIRDVRKKRLVKPPRPNVKMTFETQKQLLELWIVTLNILDFIKDFRNAELTDGVLQNHDAGVAVLQNVRDSAKAIDQPKLEHFLSTDLRQRKIAVLDTASEFQFYAAAADYPGRIFFSMDIRDLGVEVVQLYEESNARIGDAKPKDRSLLAETLRSTDEVVDRRRLTHLYVVQTFGRYHALLARSAAVRRTDGRPEALKAFGGQMDGPTALPGFDEAVQIMLGGDEVFVAAHPYFAAYIHNIIGELDTVTYKERGLNMRTCVAFSKAETADPGQKRREANQRAHHQAMKLADEAHGILKVLERTHRRIDRLIEKLEQNPRKKPDAPQFAERLKRLGLRALFVRVHHGKPTLLGAKSLADLIGRLRVGDCQGVDLVDFKGKVLDCPKLMTDAAALEKEVRDKVGRDNVRVEPPPMYGKKPKKPKDDDDESVETVAISAPLEPVDMIEPLEETEAFEVDDDSAMESMMSPVGAAVKWNNGKAYFFKGDQYVRYSVAEDWADQDYPRPIKGNWNGLWESGIDAAVMWNNGKAYFFKGDRYKSFLVKEGRADRDEPLKIKDEWPGLWERDIGAAVAWNDGKAYFFKGDEYIAFPLGGTRAEGPPKKIKHDWPGLFERDIDAALMWNDGKAYFFKGDRYIAVSVATRAALHPKPRSIKRNWPARPWTWMPVSRRASAPTRKNFPARPPGAPLGKAFIATIAGEGAPKDANAWQIREKAIFKQIVAGNVPDALANRLVRIPLPSVTTLGGRTITGSVDVMPDYLCIGDDTDYVYIPMDPVTAQRVAFELDMNLPTARICHAVYEAAGKLDPKNQIGAIVHVYQDVPGRKTPSRRAQTSTAAYAEHSEDIKKRMATRGLRLGDLVAGHKKDVVLSPGLHDNPLRIAFHGFYENHVPYEPCKQPGFSVPSCKDMPSHGHAREKSRRFSDYSQGVRLVSDDMIVDGKRMSMRKVLVDPELSLLVSNKPIDPPYIPEPPDALLKRAYWDEAEQAPTPDEAEQAPTPATTVSVPAATGLGTSATTAPIATTSPQRQMIELLDNELILIAKARIVAEWIDKKFSSSVAQALADSQLMKKLDLSKDKRIMAELRPWPGAKIPDQPRKRAQLFPQDAFLNARLRAPSTAADLEQILRLMHFYGLVVLPGITANPSRVSDILANVTRVEARLQRERFDQIAPRIEEFAKIFKRTVATGRLTDAVVEREILPQDWSPSLPDDTRRLAKTVVAVLRRLRARNTAWRLGLYAPHFWNEFSADMYLMTSLDSRQFYNRSAVRTFIDDVDAACRQTAAPGPFAWKAIYNDDPLRGELDQKFGQGRVLNAPGHGPGGDMHIHLDLRPLSVALDAQTGFRVKDGRMILL